MLEQTEGGSECLGSVVMGEEWCWRVLEFKSHRSMLDGYCLQYDQDYDYFTKQWLLQDHNQYYENNSRIEKIKMSNWIAS